MGRSREQYSSVAADLYNVNVREMWFSRYINKKQEKLKTVQFEPRKITIILRNVANVAGEGTRKKTRIQY